MKTLFLLLFAFSGMAVSGQTEFVPKDCPYGTSPVIVFEISTFNFHKPRTGCCCKFGICIQGKFGMECQPIHYFRGNAAATSVSGTVAKCWGVVNEGILELHIPQEIASINNYSSEDLSTFSLDTESITITSGTSELKNIAGDYPVSIDQGDFVIFIKLE
jgi:hypothetical protein